MDLVQLQPVSDKSNYCCDILSQDLTELSSCLNALVINTIATNSNHMTPERYQQYVLLNTPEQGWASPEQIVSKPKRFNIRIIGSKSCPSSSHRSDKDKQFSSPEFKSLLKADTISKATSNQFPVAIKRRRQISNSIDSSNEDVTPSKVPRFEDIWVSKEWKHLELLKFIKQRSFCFNNELCAKPFETPNKDDDEGTDWNPELDFVSEVEVIGETLEIHSSGFNEWDNADEDYERFEEMIMSQSVRFDTFNKSEDYSSSYDEGTIFDVMKKRLDLAASPFR